MVGEAHVMIWFQWWLTRYFDVFSSGFQLDFKRFLVGETGTQKTTGRWICLQMIQFGGINESLPRDLPICFSVGMAITISETDLALESTVGLPKRKLVSQPPFFRGPLVAVILTQRRGGFSRKLMDLNRVPGIICALGWVVVVSNSFFFWGGAGRRQPWKNSFKFTPSVFWMGWFVIQVFVGW